MRHDHRVRILLQFTVLYIAPVKRAWKKVQNRMDDKWASLMSFCFFVVEEGDGREKRRTYSTKNTVLQLTCGPRSFTSNSLPSRTPAAAKTASSSRALASPLSESFCRST